MITSRNEMIDPQEVVIDGCKFVISRLPAFDAAPVYDRIVQNRGTIPQDDKLALLSHCIIVTDKGDVVLDKSILINTYIKKWQTLNALIDKVFDLNFGLPESGNASHQ